MEKKKAVLNLFLLLILIVLIVVAVVIWRNDAKRRKDEKVEENITLRSIGYGSVVSQLGYIDSGAILNSFISGYNEHNGETVATVMDFVGMYIFSECDDPEKEFDSKYLEYMRADSKISTEEVIMLQYGAKQQESALIDSINSTNVVLEVVENSEIENVSEYLGKFKAKIRTVSAEEGIDQEDWVEFWLLHNGESYYIINYYNTGE